MVFICFRDFARRQPKGVKDDLTVLVWLERDELGEMRGLLKYGVDRAIIECLCLSFLGKLDDKLLKVAALTKPKLFPIRHDLDLTSYERDEFDKSDVGIHRDLE